jgi:hypothetical protein
VTVAAHCDVWAVVMEEGNAETETLVTVGGTTLAEIEMEVVPDFAESCVDVALTVSSPEAGAVAGAV